MKLKLPLTLAAPMLLCDCTTVISAADNATNAALSITSTGVSIKSKVFEKTVDVTAGADKRP